MKITFEVPAKENKTIRVATNAQIKFMPTRIVMSKEELSVLLAANKSMLTKRTSL